MDGMGVETNGLTVTIVVIGERVLHVFKSSTVIDLRRSVRIVPINMSTKKTEYL